MMAGEGSEAAGVGGEGDGMEGSYGKEGMDGEVAPS